MDHAHVYTLHVYTCSRHLRYIFHVSCTCIHSVHVPDISSMYISFTCIHSVHVADTYAISSTACKPRWCRSGPRTGPFGPEQSAGFCSCGSSVLPSSTLSTSTYCRVSPHTHTRICIHVYNTYVPCVLYTVFVKCCIDHWNADTV